MENRGVVVFRRDCKERVGYLIRVFFRIDCFFVFYFRVNFELCFKFELLFLFRVVFLFLFEIVLFVVFLEEGGVIEVMFIGVEDEYFGLIVVLLVVFWLLFCN